jgi:hypothetical protein
LSRVEDPEQSLVRAAAAIQAADCFRLAANADQSSAREIVAAVARWVGT